LPSNSQITKIEEVLGLEVGSLPRPRPFAAPPKEGYTDVWSVPLVKPYKGKHPCEKPSDLLKRIIAASSEKGDTVLDCCCGSGSALVAAKALGRGYIGIELDPKWAKQATNAVTPKAVSPTPTKKNP
jgi:site-specific DNA-methyltransferase (adenine-specific)